MAPRWRRRAGEARIVEPQKVIVSTPATSRAPHGAGPLAVALGALLVLAVAASCSVATETTGPASSDSVPGADQTRTRGTGGPTSTTTTRVDPPAPAPINYSRPGPYDVGITTVSLGDREVRVFYPADPAALAGAEHLTSYRPGDAYPPEVAAALAEGVPELVAELPLDAYRDVAVNDEGPFPIVLQSHGAGGSNLYSSQHLRHEASWGFVVASPDHRSRNAVAAVTGQWGGEPADVDDLRNALAALVAANADPDSVLRGGLDTQAVGVEGHSAGAATTYVFALDEPRVKVWIGQAPAPAFTGGAPPALGRPAMIVAADGDTLVPLAVVQAQYDALATPKRLVVVKGAGHATFLDRCRSIFAGGGLARYVAFGVELPGFDPAAGDGCEPANTDPAVAAPLIDHVMVAQYRIAFGDDRSDVSLDPEYLARTFPLAFAAELVDPPQRSRAPERRPGSIASSTTTTATTSTTSTTAGP